MLFLKTQKFRNLIYAALLLFKSGYQDKRYICTVYASEITITENKLNVRENIFETYFTESWPFQIYDDFPPLFPSISYYLLDREVVRTELERKNALIFIKREFKFAKEEIVEICKLQKIEFENYEFFSSLIERSIFYKHYIKGMSERENFTSKYEIEKVFSKDKRYVQFYKFRYNDKIYLLKRIIHDSRRVTLFIPELAFFEHKYIGKVHGMFLNNENLDINYTIMQYYEEQVKEYKSQFDLNKNNHNLIYNSLKMAFCVATAVEYLNLVHGRVHGDMSEDNIIATKEGEKIVYKLIDFDNSFKLDENIKINVRGKKYKSGLASPEERACEVFFDLKPKKNKFFSRKSEVWSIGALLLKKIGIGVFFDRGRRILKFSHTHYCSSPCNDSNSCESHLFNLKERLEDLTSKILIVNVKKRPNITTCVDLLYKRIIEEEKYLVALYENEEKCLENERQSFLIRKFETCDEKEMCRKNLDDKKEEFLYRKEEFYKCKRFTEADWCGYIAEKSTYEKQKKYVDEKSCKLNVIYERRLVNIKELEDKNGIQNPSAVLNLSESTESDDSDDSNEWDVRPSVEK